MLRILDRYILRELTGNVLAIVVVLLVVMAGGTFAQVLQQVASGGFPASIMFDVLGLNMLAVTAGALPLALFLGILMGLGRLYHDSEMHVLAASGMGRRGIAKPVAMLGIPVAIVVGLLSLWLGPWASRTSDQMVTTANHSVLAAGLEPGRFTAIPGRGGTLFVDTLSPDGTRLGKVFVFRQLAGTDKAPPAVQVITAARGRLYAGSQGGRRYLALMDGWQYKLPQGADDWSRMQYQENDLALAPVAPTDDNQPGDVDSGTPTATLWHADGAQARAEMAWRVAAPMATLVLMLLALPLSRQAPREPRYGRVMIAVLAYFLYFSLLSLARSLIGQDKVHNSALVWALHLIVAAASAWFFWRQYAPRKVRGAGA